MSAIQVDTADPLLASEVHTLGTVALCQYESPMSLASGNHAHGYDTEDESANKCNHKRRSYHGTAMPFVLSTLSCSQLDVALFAVYMWLWLKHTCDGLNNRLGRSCWSGCRAGRGMDVLVRVRVKFDIIVLCDCCILRFGQQDTLARQRYRSGSAYAR
jgi:hypothetical protein